MDVRAKPGCDGEGSNADCHAEILPARTEVLACESRRDLEEDVTDVERGQHFVVVISLQSKIFLETSESGVAFHCPSATRGEKRRLLINVYWIDAAEEVDDGDYGHDKKTDLPAQSCLCCVFKIDQWTSVPSSISTSTPQTVHALRLTCPLQYDLFLRP